MTNTNYAWKLYGDVNPVEHGGSFIRYEGGNSFEVVELFPNEETGAVEIHWYTVDLDDSWIEWIDVDSYAGTFEHIEKPDYKFYQVLDAVSYYGRIEFGVHTDYYHIDEVNFSEKIVKALSAWGIDFKYE